MALERRTANLIRSLWMAAGQKERSDPAFLSLLIQCGWTNVGRKNKGRESTIRWRNKRIADYLKVSLGSGRELAQALSSHFKGLSYSKCVSFVGQQTGITFYYPAFRPKTLKFFRQHSKTVALAFRNVTANSGNVENKVRKVADIIESLGEIPAAGRHISPFNGLTPVLSCLDPQCRFPIMNQRSSGLLRCIQEKPDTKGMVALSKLIGPYYGLKDAFELDAYVVDQKFPKPQTRTRMFGSNESFKDVGLKSEINSFAQIAAKKAVITKRHNKMLNDLRDYVFWRYRIAPKENRFDALVFGWKKGRDLLIEAKTASEGPGGRSQIRQAIGQLYDYRFTHMPKNKVDLAVLLPKVPGGHVQSLLASLGIEVLWFKGKTLTGTIRLCG